jgi:phage FluMu gp28-like protein
MGKRSRFETPRLLSAQKKPQVPLPTVATSDRGDRMTAPLDGDVPTPGPLVQLFAYQRRWLADKSRFKIAMVARQSGKSKFMAALEVVADVLQHEARREKARWIILSRGERQALEVMEEGIKPWCQTFGAAFEALDSDFNADSGIAYKAHEVSFEHGSRITALPANPDTARGFTASVVLDEFAIHQDSRKIWAALFPVVSRPDLKLRVLSTPNGKDNKFYELMTAQDSLWSRHTTDIYQAVAQGLDRNIEELRAAVGDEDIWAQEYELKWLDEASAWLPFELITACEDPAAGRPELYQGGLCYIGNDIAARNDLWVAWVLELVGDVLWTREMRVLRRATFAEQDAVVAELMQRYRVSRLSMDQTGMGEKPVEDARRRYPGKVEGVLFTPQTKLAVATIGKAAFEERKVRVPAGDLLLRADLHKPKKVVGATGIPRLVADSDVGGHADRFWAVMLGIAAADPGKYPPPEIFFASDEFGETDDLW